MQDPQTSTRFTTDPQEFLEALRESTLLGDLHLGSESYTDALACYQEAAAVGRQSGLAVDELATLQVKMARCYLELSRLDEARDSCREVVKLGAHVEARTILAEAQVVLSKVEVHAGRFRQALLAGRVSYDIVKGLPDSSLLAEASESVGVASAELGNVEAARDYFTECEVCRRRLGDETGLAHTYNNLGILAKRTGDLSSALRYLQKALAIDTKLGHTAMVAARLRNIGNVLFRLSRWDEAEECLHESYGICVGIGAKRRMVAVNGALGNIARGRGNWSQAEQLFDEVLTTSRESGYRRAEALALEFRGELEADRGNYHKARTSLDQALQVAVRLSAESDVVGEVLRRRAETLVELGEVDAAERDCENALALLSKRGDRLEEGATLRALARVHYARGDSTKGSQLISRAEAVLRSVGESFELAKCALIEGMGFTACADEGEVLVDRVGARLLTAFALFEEIGATDWAGRCELARARALLNADDLERARACLERARSRFEATDDSRRLSEVDVLLHELDERIASGDAAAGDRGYAVIARGYESADRPELSAADLHGLSTEIAETVSAERLVLASRAVDGSMSVAASVDLGGHGGSRAMRFLRDVAEDCALDGPVVMAAGRGEIRLPDGVGAVVVMPAALDGVAHGGYLLYADRSQSNPSAAFTRSEVDLLGAAARLLAILHLRVRDGDKSAIRDELPDGSGEHLGFPGLVARDPKMLQTLSDVDRLRESCVPVLIRGESGSGKEVIARAMHWGGRSRRGEFIALNAGAIAPHLQESELFGHVKGAFTDAHRDREGLIAAAAGGTLFLDEVGEMTPALQVKLLRFLQNGEYRRIGENRTRTSDARIVSATNKDLFEEMKAGRFRRDLLYRLCTFVIDVPPLRDRRGDVEPLMEHFLAHYTEREGKRIAGVSREVRALFLRNDWRENNVRELENEIRRAVAVCDEDHRIELEHLSPTLRDCFRASVLRRPRLSLKDDVEAFERKHILDALERCNWNKKRASEHLGISRTGLLTKMKKYGIG